MPCIHPNSTELLIEEIIMLNFRAYIIPIFIIFGIIGCSFIINSFYSIQKLQPSRFNIYIIWITIFQYVDLIMNTLLDDFLGRGLTWASDCIIFIKLDTITSFTCKIMNYIPYTSVLISNILLVIFSIDRLLTIIKPIKFRGDLYLLLPRLFIIFIIFLSMLLYLPQLIYSDLIKSDNTSLIGNYTCQYVNSLYFGVQYSLYLSTIGGYIIPTILIAIINIIIILRLQYLTKNRQLLNGKRNSVVKNKYYINNNIVNNNINNSSNNTNNNIINIINNNIINNSNINNNIIDNNNNNNSINHNNINMNNIIVSNNNNNNNINNNNNRRKYSIFNQSIINIQKQSSNEYYNEMKRIIGHLIVTSIFLFFSIPLIVIIILRQKSDFLNYNKIYPIYYKRLIHLSRLFSSFTSIICTFNFIIFLIFLPNFRYMVYLSIYTLPLIKTTKYSQKHIEHIEIKLSNRLRKRFKQSIELKLLQTTMLQQKRTQSIID
uniref:G_PROTEIN_RECEP_F1_2 domain-containing protein n=1 Tax=Schistosoma mansoni TaxID=6183 RepID=A0A5K4FAA0_SCHMA